MTRRARIIGFLGLSLLAGCTAAPAHYAKPGGSEEELQRTLARCRVQALMTPGDGVYGAMAAGAVRENCLRAEGWIKDTP